METHRIHEELLRRRVRVLVVGCGGTGSVIAAGLPYLHQAMLASGHPGGPHVTLMDSDTISPTNCVRQPFSRAEIGLYKAVVIVNRINVFWALDWEAVPTHLSDRQALSPSYENRFGRTHIVIGCVDTRRARTVIRNATGNFSTVDYWMDVGNNADSGQFILGEPLNEVNRRAKARLRTVSEWFPEIVDATLDNDRFRRRYSKSISRKPSRHPLNSQFRCSNRATAKSMEGDGLALTGNSSASKRRPMAYRLGGTSL